jgi:hypothetical protein
MVKEIDFDKKPSGFATLSGVTWILKSAFVIEETRLHGNLM